VQAAAAGGAAGVVGAMAERDHVQRAAWLAAGGPRPMPRRPPRA
jgi:hypothetical protein